MASNYDVSSVSAAAHTCTMNQETITSYARVTAMNINHPKMEQAVTVLLLWIAYYTSKQSSKSWRENATVTLFLILTAAPRVAGGAYRCKSEISVVPKILCDLAFKAGSWKLFLFNPRKTVCTLVSNNSEVLPYVSGVHFLCPSLSSGPGDHIWTLSVTYLFA